MKCNNCGTEISFDFKYCPKCGKNSDYHDISHYKNVKDEMDSFCRGKTNNTTFLFAIDTAFNIFKVRKNIHLPKGDRISYHIKSDGDEAELLQIFKEVYAMCEKLSFQKEDT